MCLAKAYITKGEGRELVMREVAVLRIEGKRICLETIFGEQKEIEAYVREVDFQNSRIILESFGL